jgi:hypothetical protein
LNLTSGGVDGSAASIWLTQTLLMIPLAVVGLYLILTAGRRPVPNVPAYQIHTLIH